MRSVEETLKTFPLLQLIETDYILDPHANYLKEAYVQAGLSNDPNTQVGAVVKTLNETPTITHPMINNTIGSHNLIIGCDHDSDRMNYPKKSEYSAHAERRALAHASREGMCTDGSTLYAPWFSCTGCAIQIGESGVRTVIGHITPFMATPERWVEDMQLAHAMMDNDYGIELYVYMHQVGLTVRMNGKEIEV